MHTMNAAQVKAVFERESILLGREDMVPEYRAATLFGKEAVDHACRLNRAAAGGLYVNGYGIGDYTLSALTYRGFLAAASYYNVQQLRKDAEGYEEERGHLRG